MQITCPSCSSRFSIDAAINDRDTRVAVAMALQLPGELGPLILRYLPLFNPRQRSLAWSRAAKLLTELNEAITAQCVRRKGRDWAVTVPMWERALTTVLERRDGGKLELPFKDHAYLYTVVCGEADKVEGAAEKQHEKTLRRVDDQGRAGQMNVAEALISSPEYIERMHKQLGLGPDGKPLPE